MDKATTPPPSSEQSAIHKEEKRGALWLVIVLICLSLAFVALLAFAAVRSYVLNQCVRDSENCQANLSETSDKLAACIVASDRQCDVDTCKMLHTPTEMCTGVTNVVLPPLFSAALVNRSSDDGRSAFLSLRREESAWIPVGVNNMRETWVTPVRDDLYKISFATASRYLVVDGNELAIRDVAPEPEGLWQMDLTGPLGHISPADTNAYLAMDPDTRVVSLTMNQSSENIEWLVTHTTFGVLAYDEAYK